MPPSPHPIISYHIRVTMSKKEGFAQEFPIFGLGGVWWWVKERCVKKREKEKVRRGGLG